MDDPFFHVPQQSRRHKLRFNDVVSYDHQQPHHFLSTLHPHHQHELTMTSSSTSTTNVGMLNLSLSSTHARTGGAYCNAVTPVGPFTGYASILGRSRFLRPAQELLEDVSSGAWLEKMQLESNRRGEILEESGRWLGDEVDEEDVSRGCCNPKLVSMLHEVYKRYKIYCQQMQSAVTSFESVAGLANAAPFICFAVRAMFRHFHCLKNAILDQIRLAGKGYGVVDFRRDCTSGSCSVDKGHDGQKQIVSENLLQHPVWRTQRGFPDKAVSVLKTWLFEHFLHPYPSDSDKQILAQKTGLSRSQVSNWFTNARVRLWKPMVEEMHALERRTQCSKAAETSKFMNLSTDHDNNSLLPQLSEKDVQIMNDHRDQESQCKRSRIDIFSRAELSKEQYGLPCNRIPSSQFISAGGNQFGTQSSHPSALDSDQEHAPGLAWSNHGQIVPFWLARH